MESCNPRALSPFDGCVLFPDDSDGVGQRPRSQSVQGSPQLSPVRSLAADYDADRQASPRDNHHHNNNHSHSR